MDDALKLLSSLTQRNHLKQCMYHLCSTILVFLVHSMCLFFIDIDECSTNSHSCDVNAVCYDTEGSYMCTCNSGYSGDGKACSGKLNSHKIATYKCFAPEALKGHEIMLK